MRKFQTLRRSFWSQIGSISSIFVFWVPISACLILLWRTSSLLFLRRLSWSTSVRNQAWIWRKQADLTHLFRRLLKEIRDQFWQLCPLESQARFLPSTPGIFTIFVLFLLFVLSILMEDIIPIFEDVKQVLFLVMSRWFITWNPAKQILQMQPL